MSWQLLEESDSWEEATDKLLLVLPILGCCFRKVYFDPVARLNETCLILPSDLIVDYWASDLKSATRVSHRFTLTRNDCYERVARGIYSEFDYRSPGSRARDFGPIQAARDERQGIAPGTDRDDYPLEMIEQHLTLDLDGDGYAEPYVLTVRRDTCEPVRLVARFLGPSVEYEGKRLIRIKPETHFVKYAFIPSPDGGFYDLGFGALLGPVNHTLNTSINQLLDSGTMATTGGGFLGRGARVRGGEISFKPNEWKMVDATGGDLKNNIVPLPVREPSRVLFDLITLLLQYGERVSGATEIMTGIPPGQNTPAETSRTTVEQAQKVLTGVFKRIWRAFKYEFALHYRLNQLYSDEQVSFAALSSGETTIVTADDYRRHSFTVRPSANPNVISDAQRQLQAEAMVMDSMRTPGYNIYAVHRRYLESLRVENVDEILPDPKGPQAIPPQPHPKVQIEQMKVQAEQAKEQLNARIALVKLAEEARVNEAKIVKLHADAVRAIAEAGAERAAAQIEGFKARLEAAQAYQDGLLRSIDVLRSILEPQQPGGMPSGPESPLAGTPARPAPAAARGAPPAAPRPGAMGGVAPAGRNPPLPGAPPAAPVAPPAGLGGGGVYQ
jgi:chaperonin GroES